MPRLTAATTLRDPSGIVTSLKEGDVLPGWAAGQVGDHLLEDEPEGRPSPDWTVAELRDYAKAHEVTLGADVTTKAAILEALNAAE